MAVKRMMQGDSYPLPFTITMNGTTAMTPDLVSEMEVCIGNESGVAIRKTLSAGSVWYDDVEQKWFFRPSQQETLDLDPGIYDVVARLKLSAEPDADVVGIKIGRISITDGQSEEII